MLEIHHRDDVGQELDMLIQLDPHQRFLTTFIDACRSPAFGRALLVDIIVQITQHFVGGMMSFLNYFNLHTNTRNISN